MIDYEGVYRTYVIWRNMLRRCENPKDQSYKWYGARGITVCERWHNVTKFFEDVGVIPKGLSLDRIDNDGAYDPANVRLSTPKEQANNRRTNRLITFNGKTQSLIEWGRETGIGWTAIWARLENGWSVEDALTEPPTGNVSTLTHKGETKTITEWAREKGFSYKVIHDRLARGWSVEKTLETPLIDCVKYYEFQGKRLSLEDWAKELGVKKRTLVWRLERGMSVEEMLGKPVRSYRKKQATA